MDSVDPAQVGGAIGSLVDLSVRLTSDISLDGILLWPFARPSVADWCPPFSFPVSSCFSCLSPGYPILSTMPPSLLCSSRSFLMSWLLSEVVVGSYVLSAKTLMGGHGDTHILSHFPENTVLKTSVS